MAHLKTRRTSTATCSQVLPCVLCGAWCPRTVLKKKPLCTGLWSPKSVIDEAAAHSDRYTTTRPTAGLGQSLGRHDPSLDRIADTVDLAAAWPALLWALGYLVRCVWVCAVCRVASVPSERCLLVGYRFSKVCFETATGAGQNVHNHAGLLSRDNSARVCDSINCLMGFLRFSSPAFGHSLSGPFDDFQRHAVFACQCL